MIPFGKYRAIRLNGWGGTTFVVVSDQGQSKPGVRRGVRLPVYQSSRRRQVLGMTALLGACLAKRAYAKRDIDVQQETRSDASSLNSPDDGHQDDGGSSNDKTSREVADTKRAIMQIEKTMRTRSLVDSMWQSLE